MSPILRSLSPRAIHLRHLLARSSSPAPAHSSSIVPNAATLATPATPNRRNMYNNTKCEERYHWLTWRVLPVLGLVFWYSQNTCIKKLNECVAELNKQNTRIKKLEKSVAELNKDKEKKTSCSCSATSAKGATASTTTDAAAPKGATDSIKVDVASPTTATTTDVAAPKDAIDSITTDVASSTTATTTRP